MKNGADHWSQDLFLLTASSFEHALVGESPHAVSGFLKGKTSEKFPHGQEASSFVDSVS